MIKVLTNLLLKTGGLVAGVIYACNGLKVQDIEKLISAIPGKSGGDSLDALYHQIVLHMVYILLCLGVIIVGYYILVNMAKALSEEFNIFTTQRRARAQREADELRDAILQAIEKTSARIPISPESRNFVPGDIARENKP